MRRRSFLKRAVAAVGAMLGASRLSKGSNVGKVPESVLGLGKYIEHRLEITPMGREDIFLNEHAKTNPYIRYVRFPIENLLHIKYERGWETYAGFNASTDLINCINRMSGAELEAYRVPGGDKYGGQDFKFDESVGGANNLFKLNEIRANEDFWVEAVNKNEKYNLVMV
jgi:hypothetical protein